MKEHGGRSEIEKKLKRTCSGSPPPLINSEKNLKSTCIRVPPLSHGIMGRARAQHQGNIQTSRTGKSGGLSGHPAIQRNSTQSLNIDAGRSCGRKILPKGRKRIRKSVRGNVASPTLGLQAQSSYSSIFRICLIHSSQ